jgi:alkanesulfonate monooxygenase SsuD/methylene tetrahydromethanopterin reductase-like flavin-dependent oxidoreductase (luciferase family)
MILDIFSEMQRAQRWSPGNEASLIRNTLEQAQLADQLGYGCWWSVEHHGAEEFSLSSTPELFNAALAMSTTRIRIGHSGVLAPFAINHPIRVAERAAFVDILSNGRLEMGLARSSVCEWQTFGVAKEDTQPQFDELTRMLPKMWSAGRFAWDSNVITIPEINVVPKPMQSFPRMWCMGMSEDGARTAGRLGVGFIGTTVMEPVGKTMGLLKVFAEAGRDRKEQVDAPNPGFGLFTFVHCAESRDKAVESRAAEAAMWYVNRAPVALKFPRERLLTAIRGDTAPDGSSWRQATEGAPEAAACDPDDPHPVIRLLNRQHLGMPIDPEEAYDAISGVDSVIIGDPEACFDKITKFKNAGVDRLLCLQQFGQLTHTQVCASIRTLGEEVLPYVAARSQELTEFPNRRL